MKTVLLAVDETKASLKTIQVAADLFQPAPPQQILLLHVQKLEGASMLDDLILSESELETLKEAIEPTEYQELLDKKTARVLEHVRTLLADRGLTAVTPLVRKGHPAEEILAVAKEKEVELIVMGCRGRRFHNLFLGSVSREVANNADCSVLLVK